MKYRIQVVKRKNGETVYFPQVKEYWLTDWENIDEFCTSRSGAMTVIQTHKIKVANKKGLVAESVTYIKVD